MPTHDQLKAGGIEWVDFQTADWIPHPDLAVDAAILPMKRVHPFDIGWILDSMALTEKVIDDEAIGVGDEIFMTGLFVNRPGNERNIPIVRVGNIAAMTAEKMASPAFIIALVVPATRIMEIFETPRLVAYEQSVFAAAGRGDFLSRALLEEISNR